MPISNPVKVPLTDFASKLLDEMRLVVTRIQDQYDELIRQNRKVSDQLLDARDRIKELEAELARRNA